MRVGEDVDLVWRIADAGHRVRYEPRATVHHDVRSKLSDRVRQRFGYGRSAAMLDSRHPGSVPPAAGSPWSVAVCALAAGGHPLVAAAGAAGTARALVPKLAPRGVAPQRSVALTLRGHALMARQLGRASVRPWLPATLAVAMWSRRARRALSVFWLASAVAEYRRRRPTMSLRSWLPRWFADEVAYTTGLWAGCVTQWRVGPLVARIHGWPDRQANDSGWDKK